MRRVSPTERTRRRLERAAMQTRPAEEYLTDAEPCPFCHTAYGFDPTNPSSLSLELTGDADEWWVWCANCRGCGPIAERELAVPAWNRATRPLVPALLALELDGE